MAKRKRTKRKRSVGPKRSVPRNVAGAVRSALSHIIRAKSILQKGGLRAKKAWSELHNCESRLSRLV